MLAILAVRPQMLGSPLFPQLSTDVAIFCNGSDAMLQPTQLMIMTNDHSARNSPTELQTVSIVTSRLAYSFIK